MGWRSRSVDGEIIDIVVDALLSEEPGSYCVVTDAEADTPDESSSSYAFVVPPWGQA